MTLETWGNGMSHVSMRRAFLGAEVGVHARVGLVKRVALTSLLCGIASSGCSLIADTELKQCKQTSDCTALFGSTAPYLCEADYCTRPACTNDAQCRARGGAFQTSICDGDKRCNAAQCTSNENCGIGAICDTATNRCTPRECQVLADCQRSNPSPTVQCTEGRCVDEIWGCIGQRDNRPVDPGLATLHIPFADGVSRVEVASATVKACQLPVFDVNAATSCTPIQGSMGSFRPGVATVSGLAAGSIPRIEIVPTPSMLELIPVDYYTQKALLGTATAPIVTTIPRGTVATSGSLYQGVDLKDPSAGAFVTTFNCLDKPAEGVILSLGKDDLKTDPDPAPPNYITSVAYFAENLMPDSNRKSTSTAGLATIINMLPGKLLTLTASLEGTPIQGTPRTVTITTLQVLVFEGRLTSIHLYPRSYYVTAADR